MTVHKLKPVDNGYVNPYDTWKPIVEWTEKEIHELVMKEVGTDIVFPVGSQVLIKIWKPGEYFNNSNIKIPEHSRSNEQRETCIGKVLRVGPEAYHERARFPQNEHITIGMYGLFMQTQRQPIDINGHYMALCYDDRFIAIVTDPSEVKTSFSVESQHIGA